MIHRSRLFTHLTFFLACIGGCASLPYSSDYPLQPGYLLSSDGALRYRVPVGWFDAQDDARMHNAVIWLVRNDYASTISISEVHLDSAAKTNLQAEGLLKLASLTLSLSAGEQSANVLRPPQRFTTNGMEWCAYELITASTRDTLRVVLARTDSRLYDITALVSGGHDGVLCHEVFSVQQRVLESLKW